MHKRLCVLIAAALLSPAAFAADGTGWYAGIDLGRTDGDSAAKVALGDAWTTEAPTLVTHVTDQWSNDLSPSGAAYGLHVGYDHVFDGGFLLGGELDYSQHNADDRKFIDGASNPYNASLDYDTTNQAEINHQYSLRAKFGYANGPHMAYVTAGPTRVSADFAAEITSTGGYHKRGTASETLSGLQWGAGYEYGFNEHWSGRIEYLRTNLGKVHYDTAYVAGSTFTSPVYSERFSQDLDFDTLRIGVNYRF